VTAAQSKCESWLRAAEPGTRAEAHKCLANVAVLLALRQADSAWAEGKGGADHELAGLRVGVHHLDGAVELTPEDITIHQGRLSLLRMAGLMPEMANALEDSIRRHPGADWLPFWKAYPREFYEARRFEQAVLLYRVLDRRFPDDHAILSNMGAALAMMRRDAEALECFKRAVMLAPEDPLDNWNLARLYDYMGQLDLADAAYRRALSLQTGEAERADAACMYSEFLHKKRGDSKGACELQQKWACFQAACSAEAAPPERGARR
jgi:Flp pilus assembly protein TadD